MHRFGIIVSALAIALTANVSGQDNWFLDKPIKEIRFTGLENISESELAGIVEPFVGKNIDNNLIIDLQSKVFALDYFEEFTLEAIAADEQQSEAILEFAVIERPIVGSIELAGNRFIRRQDILDEILLKEGDMVTRARVRSDAEAIRSLYLERGFPDIDVSGSFERSGETQADVVFEIEEGAQRKVSELLFSGISFASPTTLKRVMATKEQSLFNTGVFQESNLAEDTLAIHTYYWDRGFIDSKVVDIVRAEDVDDAREVFVLLRRKLVATGSNRAGGRGVLQAGDLVRILGIEVDELFVEDPFDTVPGGIEGPNATRIGPTALDDSLQGRIDHR